MLEEQSPQFVVNFIVYFEIACHRACASLVLEILLPQSFECWDYRHVAPFFDTFAL